MISLEHRAVAQKKCQSLANPSEYRRLHMLSSKKTTELTKLTETRVSTEQSGETQHLSCVISSQHSSVNGL